MTIWYFKFLIALIPLTVFAKLITYPVKCELPDNCPPAINQLQHGAKRCTAFLVSRNLVATNLHCIPSTMWKEKSNCNGILFVFPKSKNHESEVLSCQTVEFVSEPLEPNAVNVDLAILKTTESTNREFLNFSQVGFKNDASYTIYKVDPNSENGGGTVVKTNCDAIQNSVVNPYFTSDTSPIVNFIPCQVIPGNSGSPIMSSNNEVRGIIHSSSDGRIFEIFESHQQKLNKKVYTAFGTNFSCVHLDLFSYPKYYYPSCRTKINTQTSRQLEKEKNDELSNKINAAIKAEFELVSSKIKTENQNKMNYLRWRFGSNGTQAEKTNIFKHTPVCLELDKWTKDPLKNLTLDLVEIELHNLIDDRLRYAFKIKSKIIKTQLILNQIDSNQWALRLIEGELKTDLTVKSCTNIKR